MDWHVLVMQPVEAAGFLLYAIGLALVARRPKAASVIGALLVALQSVALASWLVAVDLGLGAGPWVVSSRALAPPAALAQLLLGILLFLRGRGVRDRSLWSALMGGIVLLLGSVTLLVRATQDVRFLGWGEITPVPISTSLLLMGFGGVAITRSYRGSGPTPRWLPLGVGFAVALTAVLAWEVLRVQRGDWIEVTAANTAETTTAVLDQQLLVHALSLRVMAEEWEVAATPPIAEWDVDAVRTSAELDAFLGFAWVTPDGGVAWSYVADRAPPLLRTDLEEAAKEATASLEQHPDRLVEVVETDSRTVLALSMPMLIGEQDLGRMVGLLEGDLLIQRLIPPEVQDDFAVAVLVGDVVVSRHGWRQDLRHVVREADVLGVDWKVVLWPNQAWLERVRSGLPEVFLIFGIGLAVALALGADLAQEARVRARQLSRALAALRQSHQMLEQRVAERTEELRLANAELARSNEDLEQFAGVASHDLKAPLHTVSLHLQVLARRMDGRVEDEDKRLFETANAALRRMSTLIDDLLGYARAGSVERNPEVFAVGDALERVLEALHGAIVEEGATIERRDLDLRVRADPGQTAQVLQNLVANALKFRGERPLRVEIGAAPQGAMVRIRVRDNGVGVEPEAAERIFAMFDRGTGAGARAAPGTGIGLATCRKIVERHGGRIGVASTPGEGSTFWFTLPRA